MGRRGQEKCICHGYLIVVLFRGGGIGVAIKYIWLGGDKYKIATVNIVDISLI